MTPDADPVAWQNRYRSRSWPSEEWSEWSEWRDGKQPELRTKAEDGGCYDTEERPLYTRPDPELVKAMGRAEAAEQRVVELVESRNGILDQRDAFHKRVKELEASRSEIIILRNTFRKRVKELEARLASEESASSQTRAERYNLAQQVKELTRRLEALQQEVSK
jgi:uncharacterized coiled-coil DUF342 family protein